MKQSKKWIIFAPLYISDDFFDCDIPANLGNGVSIINFEPYQNQLVNKDSIIRFIGEEQYELLQGIRYAFQVVVNDNMLRQLEDRKKDSRITFEEIIAEKILITNLSLWFTASSNPIYKYFLFTKKSKIGLSVHNITENIRMISTQNEKNLPLTNQCITKAKKMNNIISKMRREGALWLALRMLTKARQERDWATSFLFYWIIIKSLFGDETAKGEIIHKISERIVFFNKEKAINAKGTYDAIKKSYTWRSRIVHGRSLKKLTGEKSNELISEINELVQYSLQKIFSNKKLREKFQGNEREDFLDNLIFN